MRFVPVEEGHKAVFGREIEVLQALRIDWTGARSHIRCPYPGHADRNPSWRWDREARKAFCTCTSHPVGIFDIWMNLKGCGFAEALVEVMLVLGRTDLIRDGDSKKKLAPSSDAPKSTGCTLSAYAQMKGLPANWLRDELGLRDVELDLKGQSPFAGPAVEIPYRGVDNPPIRWRTALTKTETGFDARFRWKYGSKTRPYGVDRLPDAQKADYCIVGEGESDCHVLWYTDFPALGVPGNTNWNDQRDAPLLANIGTIYLICEPDQGGQVFLRKFQRSVLRPRLKVIYFDESIAKDPSELFLLDRNGFKAAMQAMIDKAVLYAPPAREPRRERPGGDGDNRPGQPLELPDREPWPEPVNGAEVLDEVVCMIRRYVVLSEDVAAAVALWVAGSYAFDSFYIFPRLLLTAPTRGAGKSTLLDVIEQLVNRPLSAANITAGAMFRTIDAVRPTLLLDEADTYVVENESLRNVIDSGHKRNGTTIRSVESGSRGDYWPRSFSTFCPLALACIGRLHGTIEDRSIIIGLQRRRQDEQVESFRGDRVEPLNELACKLARFIKDAGAELAKADPMMPDGIYNREADNWRPLLSVSDCAGGIWPEIARQVAARMNAENDREDKLETLLSDIRDAFDASYAEALPSNELVATLKDREDRLYDEQKLTTHKLAARLKKLKIKPGSVWIDGKSIRGYVRSKFADSFTRYLKPKNPQ